MMGEDDGGPLQERLTLTESVRLSEDGFPINSGDSSSGWLGTQIRRLKYHTYLAIEGPKSAEEHPVEKRIHQLLFLNALAFIALVILETDSRIQNSYSHTLNAISLVLISVMMVEHLGMLWACTINPKFNHSVLGRIRWQCRFMPAVDLFVIVTFWMVFFFFNGDVSGRDRSESTTFVMSFQLFRLFRLLRVLQVFQNPRVNRAFNLLYRVVNRKRDDLTAAMVVMFLSLLLVSTTMYLVEGKSNTGFNSFESIPSSMYWGVITLTTIGYGDTVPKTTPGQIVCCLVGFYAVCIGSIPVGIIGSGYVEELQAEKEQEEARERFKRSIADDPGMMMHQQQLDEVKRGLAVLRTDASMRLLTNEELRELLESLTSAQSAVQQYMFRDRLGLVARAPAGPAERFSKGKSFSEFTLSRSPSLLGDQGKLGSIRDS